MSQFPPGPPPDYPGGQQPPGPQQPGWGGQPPGGQPPGPPQQPGYPPGPQQPGWGGQQPYPPATPPSGGSGSGKVILIVVAVLAVVGIGAFVLLGDSGGSSPEDAVSDFFAAAQDRDCQSMMDLITTESFAGADPQQVLAQCEAALDAGEDFFTPGDTLDNVEVTSEDGDTAVLAVTSTTEGEQTTDEVNLRKEDGDWKIDFSTPGAGTTDPEADLPTDADDLDLPDVTIPEDFELPDSLPPECDPSSGEYDINACTEVLGG